MINASFFEESNEIRNKLRNNILFHFQKLDNFEIKEIILQRNNSSSFIKGTSCYFIHEGLGGRLSEKDKIELCSGIEVLGSSASILDNVIDNHYERNGKTTYLKEYGRNMQIMASQYALHYGFKMLMPFLNNFSKSYFDYYNANQSILGMVGMDIKGSKNLRNHIEIIEQTNGIFNEIPFVIVATNSTENDFKIKKFQNMVLIWELV